MNEQTEKFLEHIEAPTEEEVENAELLETTSREVTHFAKRKTVRRQNGRLYGQWHNTFRKACKGAPTSYIEESSILEIFEAGSCSNGEIIILCTHY